MSEGPTETRRRSAGEHAFLVLEDPPRWVPLPASGQLVVGRSRSSADLVVEHPTVSRRHARVTLTCQRVTVADLGSKNGTRLAGVLLEAEREVELLYGAVLEVGDVALVLQPHRRGLPPYVGSRSATTSRALDATGAEGKGAMRRVREVLARVAADDVSILLLGETGVGKELLAELVHARSSRASGPLVRVNCAAVTETLFESELFGHEKGAFTGAMASKAGLLEAARGGTVFLDEVGELPLPLQAKLLRVIEQRAVRRVGGREEVPVDVRFVSATNRDLEAASAQGLFRRDLYFRLSGLTVRVPPLRERLDELPSLVEALLSAAAAERGVPVPRISAAAMDILRAHPWPGNVRELRNVLVQTLLLASGPEIGPEDLPVEELLARARNFRDETGPRANASAGAADGADDALRARIEEALRISAGNQTEAARLLGVSRRTLINRLDELGIARPRKGR